MKTPYEALVEAARSLEMVTILVDWRDVEIEVASEFIQVNGPQLDIAREALRQKPSIPLEYSWDWFSHSSADHWGSLRNLANAFRLATRLANHRGDMVHAVDIAIDGLELANVVRRGGLISEAQISVVFFIQFIDLLRSFRSNLVESSRSQLLEQLTRIEAERESFQSILERVKRWNQIVGPPPAPTGPDTPLRLDPVESGFSIEDQEFVIEMVDNYKKSLPRGMDALMVDQDLCTLASLRLLRLDLCLRSYQEKHSGYPESLGMLVPDLLKEIPIDPFSGKPFVYRKKSDISFDLYSFGPGRIDHGGHFGSWQKVLFDKADYCLDCHDYEDEFSLS